ncbi:MAG: SRPBCC domain-containing protein [Paracoccaceae bacterium]
MTETRMTLTTEGDCSVVVTRRFAAPPEVVFRAHIDPTILPRWMTGPEGWFMPVCISEAWPGGRLRCEWEDGSGGGFHLTGEYLEIEAPHRIVHVERMHLPDPTPDNRVETRFLPDGNGTRLEMTMTLPDPDALSAMLATGMEEGMEASYARLDRMMAADDV